MREEIRPARRPSQHLLPCFARRVSFGGTRRGVQVAPHVLGGFNRGDEFEDDVCEADDADDGAEDLIQGVHVEEDGPGEDVDWGGG